MDERRCGDCTECCRSMAVPELRKPFNVWCEHCAKGKGCKIYHLRPDSCRTFQCLWYANEDLPDLLRPDHSRIVFENMGDGNQKIVLGYATPGYDPRRNPVVAAALRTLMENGFAVVISLNNGKERHMLLPSNRDKNEVWNQVLEYAQKTGAIPAQRIIRDGSANLRA